MEREKTGRERQTAEAERLQACISLGRAAHYMSRLASSFAATPDQLCVCAAVCVFHFQFHECVRLQETGVPVIEGTQMVACMYSPGRQAILESDFATTAALGIQVRACECVWGCLHFHRKRPPPAVTQRLW